MPEHAFTTPRPIDLHVEIRRGDIAVVASEVETTRVHIDGPGSAADEVEVRQDGDAVRVVGPPRPGLLGRYPELEVRVEVPLGSRATVRTGSADIGTSGPLAEVQLETGSGDVRVDAVDGEAHLKTGSGDVALHAVGGDATVKTGSGDVGVERVGGALVVTTGSGDLVVERYGVSATLRTGSGDVRVDHSSGALTVSTGSGDVTVGVATGGSVQVKAASGDLLVGVPSGTPVWTDLSTSSGRVRSDLAGVGAPTEGQEHLELRVRTSSGDVHLRHA